MSTLLDLPVIHDCAELGCSYNHDGCHAGAVTVGGTGDSASCQTFVALTDVWGGIRGVQAHVGACQRIDCAHNDHLECVAAEVSVGAGTAQCLTYVAA